MGAVALKARWLLQYPIVGGVFVGVLLGTALHVHICQKC